MLYPYPGDFPTSHVIDLALAFVRGEGDPKEGAHAAWHAAGYLLSRWDQHPPLVYGSVQLSPEEQVAAFQALKAYAPDGARAAVTAAAPAEVPWDLIATVAPILLDALLRWLRSR